MTLRFEITSSRDHSVPEVTARVQAVRREIRDEIRELVTQAVDEGRRIAEMEAPRGHERDRSDGNVAIGDAIRVSEVRYAPGGAGGGGFYEADLYVDSEIAPQIRFVMEGTAEDGRGLIRPAQGNVFPIHKNGEGIHFRTWVHGQLPQTSWWDHAREEVEHALELGTRSIK